MSIDPSIVQQLLDIEEAAYRVLVKNGTAIPCELAEGLPSVDDTPVEIFSVPSDALLAVYKQPATGCTMLYDGRYVIFLSDAPTPGPSWMPSLKGHWLRRYYLLHEYGHIRERDVLRVDPNRVASDLQDDAKKQAMEDRADSWAAFLLADEAEQAEHSSLQDELREYINFSSFSDPRQSNKGTA